MDEIIDINDYIPADEEIEFNNYVDILNIFNCYYKQLNEKKQNATLFDNIDYEKEESTNKCLEFLYQEILKYNSSNDENKDLLYEVDDKEINIDQWDEMYVLYIDNEQKYTSKFLLPLLQYVATIEWTKTNWNIKPFKN